MTTTVIFNDFKGVATWRNRYRRTGYQLWDANLHHGDVRPFSCPELLYSYSGAFNKLVSFSSCDKLEYTKSYGNYVRGFTPNQYFYISKFDNKLWQCRSNHLCTGSTTIYNDSLAGSPAPITAPSLNGPACTNSECDISNIAYVYTYVTDIDGVATESSPSPPSYIVVENPDSPSVTVTTVVSALNFNVTKVRIYRTVSNYEDGTTSLDLDASEFVLVGEVSVAGHGSNVYLNDTLSTSETGYPLTTYDPMSFPAPQANLKGVVRTTDGIAVADEHRVYISNSGEAQFTFDGVVEIEDNILHIEAINNNIFVFTDDKPVKIAYRHTDQTMSIDRQVIHRHLPLTSIKSVSIISDRIYFASEYGLYIWDLAGYGSDIKLISSSLFTPEQWKSIGYETICGTAYEFGYIFSSDNLDYSLMLEFGQDGTDTINNTTVMPISYINASIFGTSHDGHIMYQQKGTNNVYLWDWRRNISEFDLFNNLKVPLREQCECCNWKLAMYFDNEGKNRFSKMRVEWDEVTATHIDLDFYLESFGKEEQLGTTMQVVNSRGFSIPKFKSSQTVRIELSSCGILHEIRLGTSSQELVSSSNNLIGNA